MHVVPKWKVTISFAFGEMAVEYDQAIKHGETAPSETWAKS